MIIGINASYLAFKEKTGIENFSSQLILSLLEFDQNNSYYLFSPRQIDKKCLPKTSNYKIFVSPFPRGWHRFRLPLSLIRHKVDLFFDPGYTVLPFLSIPCVAFIHDLAHKYFPDSYSASQRKNLERSFRLANKRAKAIVFASKQTQSDFNKFYPNAKGIEKIIYQGYPKENFNKTFEDQPFLKISEKYILFVGRIESRKNISNLVKAYTILRHSHPEIRHKLVLAGKPGYGHANISKQIKQVAKFSKDIIEIGYVPDKYISRLYRFSDVFVFPSLYEGFGIPILEAFAAGTPVICSNTSSIPEVAADAALYFEPNDPQDISQKIYQIISQPLIKKELIKKGKVRVKDFSWQNYCEILLNLFMEVLK